MIIFEFLGGPGAGKTSAASYIYSKLKQNNFKKVDFIREQAQLYIHRGQENLLENHLLMLADDYQRMLQLKKQKCRVVIHDSSLLLGKIYGKYPLNKEIYYKLIDSIRSEFTIKTTFVMRQKGYDEYGRLQTEQEAKELDALIRLRCEPFDYMIEGNETGYNWLYNQIKETLE